LTSIAYTLPPTLRTDHLVGTAIARCADCDSDTYFGFGLELIVQGARHLSPGEGLNLSGEADTKGASVANR
jgi:hypothetical protein